ncbi:unnamed protein product [Ilex paraguariensis]|uniref:SET and MYND domain-containing protein 4 n=1 Tax=Ilex paraguariensis TaxID=185542 RepID=A0ABC8RNZ9_9AQUA
MQIILKPCRETHCHFCLNKLPADTVPCPSCSMPLYCSQQCQVQAGGKRLRNDLKSYGVHANLSGDLEKYIADIILAGVSVLGTECLPEHRHECQGVNWPAVLPSDIVLAGRVLVKSVEHQRHFSATSCFSGSLDLCNNYVQLPSESKLDFHIYSIILLYCLQLSYGSECPMNGVTIAQCVMLLSKIKFNSMAVVRMNFIDVDGPQVHSRMFSSAGDSLTSTMEQVRVGQAIYSSGSLFNHSCKPNIHSYFLSRTLYIRSTEFVVAGCPLELSYGPQVGQWDCNNRQRLLKDQYSFRCQCNGCAELNLSDLVLNAFRCVQPCCFGVVLDSHVAKYEKQKVNAFLDAQVRKLKNDDDLYMVACHLFEETSSTHQFEPGCCLCCGSYRDLEASSATVNKAVMSIRRLEDAIAANEVPTNILSDALGSLDMLRSTTHAYNKKIAEAEDHLAQALCLVGQLQPARDHCEVSIDILEKLYEPNHLVIGNELLKLASIQLALGDPSAVHSIKRADAIFSRYYGPHANVIFPHLQDLKREASNTVL